MPDNWKFDRDNWSAESIRFRTRLSEISDFVVRHDLIKMLISLETLSLEILREEAQRKTHSHQSQIHAKLMTEFEENRQNFIEYMTLGLLSL